LVASRAKPLSQIFSVEHLARVGAALQHVAVSTALLHD
jgi:hypothetical protein